MLEMGSILKNKLNPLKGLNPECMTNYILSHYIVIINIYIYILYVYVYNN